jgi:hypothetical protein
MAAKSSSLHPSFVTDAKGRRVSVLLPIAEFEQLLEDLEDLARVAERRDEETLDHTEVVRRLRADDLL